MPREPYRDRQTYDRDEERREAGRDSSYRRRKDSAYEDEKERRAGGSSSRSGDVRISNSSSSKREGRDPASLRRDRRRSYSPDFERDRAKERQAYDRRNDSSDNRNGNSHRAIQEDGEELGRGNNEPVFEASGLLAKESNNKNGVALKYSEPAEARKPKRKWRLYVFKDGKEIDVLHISRQSCYLMGRDRAVADIPIDHASISKQHAVIQFRNIKERNEFGDEKQSIKPFLIDLDSANGCSVNDIEVPPSRYYEMRNGDTLKLGGSLREYVLLAEE